VRCPNEIVFAFFKKISVIVFIDSQQIDYGQLVLQIEKLAVLLGISELFHYIVELLSDLLGNLTINDLQT
jgi:hypothetical protein